VLLVYVLTGFAISLVSVPLITTYAIKAQILDIPSERKVHIDNTPLLGGLGIFIAYISIIIMLDSYSERTIALISANFIIVTTGILDDIINLNAKRKLFGQIVAVTVIIFFTDIRFSISSFHIDFLSTPFFTILLTYLWIVGVTNALNLVDGMDGLAGGIAFMAFGAIGYAAYVKGFELNAYICMGLMGATLGFLRYNIPPAKVFMGDTGSLFLGFNIAVMSIAASHTSGTLLSVLIPVMFISLPLFDTFLAIVRRVLKGQNPMEADKEHLHHRLLSLEFSTVQTLMIFYSLSIVLMAVTLFSIQKEFLWGVIFVFLLLYLFFIILKLSHLYDIGSKIRILNERMRIFAYTLSGQDDETRFRIRSIDFIVITVTFLMLSRFIWTHQSESFIQLASTLLFAGTLITIIIYRSYFHIKNEFVSFAFFWVFFYMMLETYSTGLGTFEIVCFGILAVCIFIKTAISKQMDLFISNPMELIILFIMLLVFMSSNIPAKTYFFITLTSFIIYYANKTLFTYEGNVSRSYMTAVVVLILFFFVNNSAGLMKTNVGGETISLLTPKDVKTALKDRIKNEDFDSARQVLITYESRHPFELMKVEYQSEAAKVYFNLMLETLFSGDIDSSDMYLHEFLTMFPDLVHEFYGLVEPVINKVGKLDVKGTGDIMIHGTPLNTIITAYSGTLKSFADNYARKGYFKKSESYTEVAALINNFSR